MRLKSLLTSCLLVSLLLWPNPGAPQDCSGVDAKLAPIVLTAGFQTITVAAAAVGLTVPEGAIIAVLVVETAAIRYQTNGVDPTVDVGMLVNAAESITICSPQTMARFRMIRDTGTSAVVSVSYYGVR